MWHKQVGVVQESQQHLLHAPELCGIMTGALCNNQQQGKWRSRYVSLRLLGACLVQNYLVLQEEGSCLNMLVGHSGSVRSIALDQHGKIAVSAGEDGTGRVWNLATGDCVQLLLGHTSLGEGYSLPDLDKQPCWTLVFAYHSSESLETLIQQISNIFTFPSDQRLTLVLHRLNSAHPEPIL